MGFVAFKKHHILRKQVLFCRVKISVASQKACQNFHLLAVGLTFAIFPRTNQGCCNTHFCRQMAGRQVFLMAFDLNPIANCLYALRQRFSMVLFSQFMAEFYGNPSLCNTQQSYLPLLG